MQVYKRSLGSIIFVVVLSSMLIAQHLTDQFTVEHEQDAVLSLTSSKAEESDLESWTSGINFLSHFDGTQLGWSILADGKDRSLRFLPHSGSDPVIYIGHDRGMGFGTDKPEANFDFRSSVFENTMFLGTSLSNKGLILDAGVTAKIINQHGGYLDFKIENELISRLDLANNFTSKKNIRINERLSLGDNSDLWGIFAAQMGCNGNSHELAFSHNFVQKASIDKQTGDFCSLSDRRLKKNITPLEAVSARVHQLQSYSYQYVHQFEDESRSIGFIAQEVKELFPEAVHYHEHTDSYTLAYRTFSILALKALQERQSILDDMSSQIQDLEIKLAQLKSINP